MVLVVLEPEVDSDGGDVEFIVFVVSESFYDCGFAYCGWSYYYYFYYVIVLSLHEGSVLEMK